MNPASPVHGKPTRARFVGAARPHTPRLHSPPEEADAGPEPPRPRTHLRLRTRNNCHPTIQEITKEIGQDAQERYSSQLGGSVLDALLAHFSVSVSTWIIPHRRIGEHLTPQPNDRILIRFHVRSNLHDTMLLSRT